MTTGKDQSPGLDNPAFYAGVKDVPSTDRPRGSVCSQFSDVSVEGVVSTRRQRTIKENTFAYFTSRKGRELCMGSSLMMAVTLIVIALTLLFSHHLSEVIVDSTDLSAFLILLFAVSTSSTLVIIVLGYFNKLTNDDHYKDQRRTTFVRGGMTVLATGAIVYYGVELASMVHSFERCHPVLAITRATLAIIFVMLQVIFLLRYSKIRINRTLAIVTGSRFMLMIIIATNTVVWFVAVIAETLEELEHSQFHTSDHNDTVHMDNGEQTTHATFWDKLNSQRLLHYCHEPISHEVSPFLFPFLIESCVMASTMTLAIWEKCGVGLERKCQGDADLEKNSCDSWEQDNELQSSSTTNVGDSVSRNGDDNVKVSGFYNSNLGFACGWLALSGAIVCILLVIFGLYSTKNARWLAYSFNFLLVVCGILAIPLTLHKMSRMRFKDEQIRRQRKGDQSLVKKPRLHRKLEQNLLTLTFLALMSYKMLSILVALHVNDSPILMDAIASIIHGFMQTAFLNWYACHKRAKTRQEYMEKPGRQFLGFLRMLNLSLWLINTFLLKQTHAKRLHQETFGVESWVIISNILQPLTILYYFHSMVCIAEVIARSYTGKYVGIPRPAKSNNLFDRKRSKSLTSFMSMETASINAILARKNSASLPGPSTERYCM